MLAKPSENAVAGTIKNYYKGFVNEILATDVVSARLDFKLDTKDFNDICAQYKKQVSVFMELKNSVNSTLDTISRQWDGKGKEAFKKQSENIRQNLVDLMDIIGEMQNVLIDSGVSYTELDSQIGKQMESDK